MNLQAPCAHKKQTGMVFDCIQPLLPCKKIAGAELAKCNHIKTACVSSGEDTRDHPAIQLEGCGSRACASHAGLVPNPDQG